MGVSSRWRFCLYIQLAGEVAPCQTSHRSCLDLSITFGPARSSDSTALARTCARDRKMHTSILYFVGSSNLRQLSLARGPTLKFFTGPSPPPTARDSQEDRPVCKLSIQIVLQHNLTMAALISCRCLSMAENDVCGCQFDDERHNLKKTPRAAPWQTI